MIHDKKIVGLNHLLLLLFVDSRLKSFFFLFNFSGIKQPSTVRSKLKTKVEKR